MYRFIGSQLALVVAICAVSICGVTAFQVEVNDTQNKFYLNTTMELSCHFTDEDGKISEVLQVSNATWRLVRNYSIAENDTSGKSAQMYDGVIDLSSQQQQLRLSVKAAKDGSDEDETSYVEEFYVAFELPGARERDFNETNVQVVVEPPRFTHFQVKNKWRFGCTKTMSIGLCIPDGPVCSDEEPQTRLRCRLSQSDVTFGISPEGGEREPCPLEYETRPDIGIACIATFWAIVLAVTVIFLGKFIMKRMREKDY